jgi:ribosomal protein L37AE/L43A
MPISLKDALARKSPERRAAIEAEAAKLIAEERDAVIIAVCPACQSTKWNATSWSCDACGYSLPDASK